MSFVRLFLMSTLLPLFAVPDVAPRLSAHEALGTAISTQRLITSPPSGKGPDAHDRHSPVPLLRLGRDRPA